MSKVAARSSPDTLEGNHAVAARAGSTICGTARSAPVAYACRTAITSPASPTSLAVRGRPRLAPEEPTGCLRIARPASLLPEKAHLYRALEPDSATLLLKTASRYSLSHSRKNSPLKPGEREISVVFTPTRPQEPLPETLTFPSACRKNPIDS